MMPTFPSSPLRFRTAGFPQYGSKAGLSDRAFPDRTSVKLAPSMPVAWSGLPPSFVLFRGSMGQSVLSRRPPARSNTAMRATYVALLQGPSLRSRLCCPGPSTLNRPHPPHSRAHPHFTDLRLIGNACAVPIHIGLSLPATGSELSLMFFRNMSSSETTGNSPVAFTQYFTGDSSLHLGITVSAFPSSSHSDSSEVCVSRLDYGSLALRPVASLALLSELTRLASS